MPSFLGPPAALLVLLGILCAQRVSGSEETHDVCILGAGAGGMYAAAELQAHGKDVVVIEQKERVGGNCYSYPSAGGLLQIGVLYLPDNAFVRGFLDSVGVQYQSTAPSATLPVYIDFSRGEELPASPGELTGGTRRPLFGTGGDPLVNALIRLASIFSKYSFYHNFTRFPDSIPAELLVPYSEFEADNGLQPLNLLLRGLATGIAATSDQPAYHVLFYLQPDILEIFTLNKGLVVTPSCDALYSRIGEQLGDKLILSAAVTSVERPSTGPATIAYSQLGSTETFVLSCDHVMVAFDQSLAAMSMFDLDDAERSVFKELIPQTYDTAAIRYQVTPGYEAWPHIQSHINYDPEDTSVPYAQPKAPYLAMLINYFVSGDVVYANPQGVNVRGEAAEPVEEVAARWRAELEHLAFIEEGSVEVLNFQRHEFAYRASVERVREGFFAQLHALQGHRNTFYLGSAFSFDLTAACWRHAHSVTTRLLKELE